MLLMENILFAILPVGEISGVAAAILDGLFHLQHFRVLLFCLLAKSTIVNGPGLGSELHLVRVNDLGFLLGVERDLVALHICVLKFVAKELLLVLREQVFRVRVSDKSVGAPSEPASVIPSRQLVV
jgi:hypothetical protein